MTGPVVRVLLVEDDEDDYLLTSGILAEGFGRRFHADWVTTPAAGLERLTTDKYDVALVDYNLGGETGLELLRAASARGCRVPIIMLTGQDNRATDLEAMHAGAADYLVKGRVSGDMLERAIRYARERTRLLERIRSLSLSDELTGLSNRRAFFALAEQRLQLPENDGTPHALLFADVDGLKEANDTMGHEVGDKLLVDAARVLRAIFRRKDLVARLGGDEFVVLSSDTEESDLPSILDELEKEIAVYNATKVPGTPPLSISAGIHSFRASPAVSLRQLVAKADALMLERKKERRGERSPSRG